MRRVLLLVSSLAVVMTLGGLAVWSQVDTGRQVTAVHGGDRSELQATLSGLTGQYMQFTFLAASTAAQQTPWSLRPGDPADRARLARLVQTSPLTPYGAALVSVVGTPLTDYSTGAPLPPATDPGYAPMRSALLAGRPGLSGVMASGDTAVVAFAVPVRRGNQVLGLLLSYADVRRWPLQGYDEKLQLGATAIPYVVDASGVVAASGDVSAVGRPMVGLAGLTSRSGTVHLNLGGRPRVVTYARTEQGWMALTVQDESAFSGPLRAGRHRDLVVLVALLTLVVALLVLFHYKRQQVLQRLADDRLYDPLTGLAQRRLFEIRLEAALARQRRSGRAIGLLYCDLDGFKGVNDRHGHNIGDSLLALVSGRLLEGVREDDMVVRLGGDEFAILVEGTSPLDMRRLVRRLRTITQQPAVISNVSLEPRLSIGGAVLIDVERAADLMHEADLAMYQVKTGQDPDLVVVTELTAAAPVPVPREPTVDTRSRDNVAR